MTLKITGTTDGCEKCPHKRDRNQRSEGTEPLFLPVCSKSAKSYKAFKVIPHTLELGAGKIYWAEVNPGWPDWCPLPTYKEDT